MPADWSRCNRARGRQVRLTRDEALTGCVDLPEEAGRQNRARDGAGRGLGRAIALNQAEAGAQVALLARAGDELDQTAKQVREFSTGLLAIQADVSNPGQLSAAAGWACGEPGDVHVLINSAAVVTPLGPVRASTRRSGWARSASTSSRSRA